MQDCPKKQHFWEKSANLYASLGFFVSKVNTALSCRVHIRAGLGVPKWMCLAKELRMLTHPCCQ